MLVRAIMQDEPKQSRLAQAALSDAELVAIPIPALCELVWVLSQGYRLPSSGIAAVVRRLIDSGNVATNRTVVEAGLSLLEAGGDFADGVIALEGTWLGGETFLSFDKKAIKLIDARGGATQLLN